MIFKNLELEIKTVLLEKVWSFYYHRHQFQNCITPFWSIDVPLNEMMKLQRSISSAKQYT